MKHFVCAIRQMSLAASIVLLMSACTTSIRSDAQAGDNYQKWHPAMAQLPYFIHYPDGRVVLTDQAGKPIHDGARESQELDEDRVEVFLGAFASVPDAPCRGAPAGPAAASSARTPNVAAALCARQRTVVSYIEHVAPDRLAQRQAYLSHANTLLDKGLGGLDGGDPDASLQ